MGPESIGTVRLGQLTMTRQAGAFSPASQAIGHWSAGMDSWPGNPIGATITWYRTGSEMA